MTGQAVLGLIGVCFGSSFYWLSKSLRIDVEERFLRTDEALP